MNIMGGSSKIIQLRQILAERFPQETLPLTTLFSIGLPLFDHLNALVRGHITEMITPRLSSGGTLLLHEIIRTLQQSSQFVALVDARNSFYPIYESKRLLWIRCQHVQEAIKATDLLLRDGNIELIILDLKESSSLELRRIPSTTWYRFQRVAEESRTTLLAMTPHRMISNSFAEILLLQHLSIDDLSLFSTDLFIPNQWKINKRKNIENLFYVTA
jgi:hypothetical protein